MLLKIAFIGGGNMSTCIFDSILNVTDLKKEIIVSSPHISKLSHFQEHGAIITDNNLEAIYQADIIFLGVKPQILGSVLQSIKDSKLSISNKLFISMAAGFKCQSIFTYLNTHRIVRIMPNTPAKVGLGVNGVYFDGDVDDKNKNIVLHLLSKMGMNIVVDNEELINSICVVAGSAPAFLFRFMEAMIANGIRLGLSEKDARLLTEQVILGTGVLAKNSHDQKISQLREAVTSKGGTTFEGLKVMTEYKFEEMMNKVADASLNRAHDFEKMF